MITNIFVVGSGPGPGGNLPFSVTYVADLQTAIDMVPTPPAPLQLLNRYAIILTDPVFDATGTTFSITGNRRVLIIGWPGGFQSPHLAVTGVGSSLAGPTFLVGGTAEVEFHNLFFLVGEVSPGTPHILSDGEPGGRLAQGTAVRVVDNATAELVGCRDLNVASPGVTMYSAFGVRSLPSLRAKSHRSFVWPNALGPAMDDEGSIFGSGFAAVEVRDSVLPVLPRAITSVLSGHVVVERTLFEKPTVLAQIPASGHARHAVLHRYQVFGPLQPLATTIEIRDSTFIECLHGLLVRGFDGQVPANSSIDARVERCMFVGFNEDVPDGAKPGEPQVWGHLVAVEWKLRVPQRGSFSLLMENNISRSMSEDLRITGWWWSYITMQNNTSVYTRFSCVHLLDPNTPPTDALGFNAYQMKNLWITNNLFQTGEFTNFSLFANNGQWLGLVGVSFDWPSGGAAPASWDTGGALGSLKVGANYFANFNVGKETWDQVAGTTLNPIYFVPTPGNSASAPPTSALVGPPFISVVTNYAPRVTLDPPVIDASDDTYTQPPSRDFFSRLRIPAADIGAVETSALIQPVDVVFPLG